MKATIEINDKQLQDMVEKLRGEKGTKEFLTHCAEAGIKMIAARAANPNLKQVRFSTAKPEFRTMDVATVTETLKQKDPAHPVVIEVNRLVNAYARELGMIAAQNGKKLPPTLRIQGQAPIEQVAFQITANAIKASNAAAQKTPEQKTPEQKTPEHKTSDAA